MKKMSTIVYSLIAMLSLFLLTACSQGSATSPESSTDAAANSNELPYIGILQLTSHPALDVITEGIIDQLATEGYIDGETAVIDLQNAQGDQANMQSIAERFIGNNADVMVGIATPAAQTLANATDEIPVILGAIYDPVGANLVDSLEEPGRNVTGVTDQAPVQEQFELMLKLDPSIKKVGLFYSSSEDNSHSAAKRAEEAAANLGLETVTVTVSSTNEVQQAAESLAAEVDAIWVPTDNTVASSMAALVDVTDAYAVPVFPSVNTMVEQGGVAAIGINQYSLGTETGMITADILEGADPATYPVRSTSAVEVTLNVKKAEELGITIPEEVRANAIIVE